MHVDVNWSSRPGLLTTGVDLSFPARRINDVAVEHVLESRARLAECPVWDPGRQTLDWVDIYNHRIHQFDPASGRDRHFDAGDMAAAIALAGGNRLLVALRDRLAFLNLDDGSVEPLRRVEFAASGYSLQRRQVRRARPVLDRHDQQDARARRALSVRP